MSRWPILSLFLVVVIVGGCARPPYTNIDNDQLKALRQQGVPIYDIRRPEEWRETGIVEGSRLLTFVDARGQLLSDFLPRLTTEVAKDQPVILICRTGSRTDALARYLVEELGYRQVYNVRDGITRWRRDGHPVVRP